MEGAFGSESHSQAPEYLRVALFGSVCLAPITVFSLLNLYPSSSNSFTPWWKERIQSNAMYP